MKPVLFIVLFALASCDSEPASLDVSHAAVAPQTDIFLVAGQSNARGRHGFSGWRQLIDNQTDWTSWGVFASRHHALTGHRVVIVNAWAGASGQVTVSDTMLGEGGKAWDERGRLWQESVTMLDSVLVRNPSFVFGGVLWVQGSKDGQRIDDGMITAREYQRSLVRMIDRYRTRYGATMPFYIFKVGQPQSGDTPGYAAVREAQSSVARLDPLTFMAHGTAKRFAARGMMVDERHFGPEALWEMGLEGAGVVAGVE